MFKFDCGDLLQDRVTLFNGIVMAITRYSTGCIHYGLLPLKLNEKGGAIRMAMD